MSYRKFVQSRMFKGLGGSERVSLLIVTRPGGEWSAADVAAYNEDSPHRLKRLLRSLRRAFPELAYFWTAELQRNGSVHFNVLLRGLPFVRLPAMRELVMSAGFGPRFSLNLERLAGVVGVDPSGVGKAGAYITKAVAYIAKGAPEWMGRRNLYGFSRNWAPGFVDERRAILTVDAGLAYPDEPSSTIRRVVSGTRRELVAAGYAVPPAGRMFTSEAEAFAGWKVPVMAAELALWSEELPVRDAADVP